MNNVKLYGKIDFKDKKINFKLYDSSNNLKFNKTFNISIPSKINMKSFGVMKPYIGEHISCTWGGVPFSQQQLVPTDGFVRMEVK